MADLTQLKAHILKRVELSDADFDRFVSRMKVVRLKKRGHILKAGDTCVIQAYVNKGVLRSYYTDQKGSDHVMQFAFEDWWIGDIASFVSGEPAFFSVEALEECELFVFEKEDIERSYNEIPRIERFFRLLIQNSLVAFQKRLLSNMSQSAEERYLTLITKFPALELRVAQLQIASFLGISPEALSRIRKIIIERERGRTGLT